jgi:hypothetical protein
MPKLPTGKPIIPFTPTADNLGNPTVCKACGGLAFGIGRATPGSKDPGYLCKPCIVAIGDLTKLDRLSLYEVKALEKGVDAGGEWLAEKGITDVAHLDELDRLMFCKAIWQGCTEGVREALRDAPF